tara:strand:- start:2506 stop:3606 length:1101 start_codon:yes stop_codon:yes gene_type:complete
LIKKVLKQKIKDLGMELSLAHDLLEVRDEDISELQDQLMDANHMQMELRDQVAIMETAVDQSYDRESSDLEGDLFDLEAELDEIAAEDKPERWNEAGYKERTEHLQQQRDELRQRVAELEAEVKRLHEEWHTVNGKVAELETNIADKAKIIEIGTYDNQQLIREGGQRRDYVYKQNDRIAELEAELGPLREHCILDRSVRERHLREALDNAGKHLAENRLSQALEVIDETLKGTEDEQFSEERHDPRDSHSDCSDGDDNCSTTTRFALKPHPFLIYSSVGNDPKNIARTLNGMSKIIEQEIDKIEDRLNRIDIPRCNKCGGKQVYIRPQYPNLGGDRLVCACCATEKLESAQQASNPPQSSQKSDV